MRDKKYVMERNNKPYRWLSIGFVGCLVVRPGFEPGQTEPKTVVLPLHHRTISGLQR